MIHREQGYYDSSTIKSRKDQRLALTTQVQLPSLLIKLNVLLIIWIYQRVFFPVYFLVSILLIAVGPVASPILGQKVMPQSVKAMPSPGNVFIHRVFESEDSDILVPNINKSNLVVEIPQFTDNHQENESTYSWSDTYNMDKKGSHTTFNTNSSSLLRKAATSKNGS